MTYMDDLIIIQVGYQSLNTVQKCFLILILITCVIPIEKIPPKKETIPLQLLKKKSNNQATLVLYFLHLLIWRRSTLKEEVQDSSSFSQIRGSSTHLVSCIRDHQKSHETHVALPHLETPFVTAILLHLGIILKYL